MIFTMSPKMDVICVIFSQEIVWKGAIENCPIDSNESRIYWLLHKHQILLSLLQGVQVDWRMPKAPETLKYFSTSYLFFRISYQFGR